MHHLDDDTLAAPGPGAGPQGSCLDDATVAALVAGELAAPARRVAEAHIDGCPSCLALLAALARGSDAAPLAGPPAVHVDGQRYLLGSELARGGMGRIVVAEDRLLRRRVALKLLIQPARGLAERFRREIAITARLQHPAIVPVYDAGVLPDGQPFFAMRLISGKSLDRAVAAAPELADRLALLPSVMAAVDAIAYAHSQGVVHRDLKPQNVLVGGFGETVVLDWGLAKARGDGDPPPAAGFAEASGPVVASDPEATRDGDILGTLGYMAPEQAAGRAADQRSDVYGLGAILYHVVTGRPPHPGRTRSLGTAVLREAPEPVQQVIDGVRPDLAALISRALALDPAERYASAGELAHDLRRFLGGQLVSAHHYSLVELLRRYVARHRAVFAVATAAVAVLTILLVLGAGKIIAEREHAEIARAHAEAAQATSERQRQGAEALIDVLLGDLRDRLEKLGRLDVLAGAGNAVSAYYERAVPREGAAGVADHLQRARALLVVGEATRTAGDLGAAETAFVAALAAAEAAAQFRPDQRADENMFDALTFLTRIDLARADHDRARARGQRALDIARRHAVAGAREWQRREARALAQLGDLAMNTGDATNGRRLYEQSYQGAMGAEDEPFALKLAARLGALLVSVGDPVGADKVFGDAMTRARARHAQLPGDHEATLILAVLLHDHAAVTAQIGALAAATPLLDESERLLRGLLAHDPANTEWETHFEAVIDLRGHLARAGNDYPRALRYFEEAIAIAQRKSARVPSNIDWLRSIAISYFNYSNVLSDASRPEDGEAAVRAAVAAFERVVEKSDEPRSNSELAKALVGLANLENLNGRSVEARATIERAVAIHRDLLAAADTPVIRQDLGMALLVLSDVQRRHDPAGERRTVEEARQVAVPLRELAGTDQEVANVVGQIDEAVARMSRRR